MLLQLLRRVNAHKGMQQVGRGKPVGRFGCKAATGNSHGVDLRVHLIRIMTTGYVMPPKSYRPIFSAAGFTDDQAAGCNGSSARIIDRYLLFHGGKDLSCRIMDGDAPDIVARMQTPFAVPRNTPPAPVRLDLPV